MKVNKLSKNKYSCYILFIVRVYHQVFIITISDSWSCSWCLKYCCLIWQLHLKVLLFFSFVMWSLETHLSWLFQLSFSLFQFAFGEVIYQDSLFLKPAIDGSIHSCLHSSCLLIGAIIAVDCYLDSK